MLVFVFVVLYFFENPPSKIYEPGMDAPRCGEGGVHIGPKSLSLAPQEILDISGYQWGFGRQFVKAYNNENPFTDQKIL